MEHAGVDVTKVVAGSHNGHAEGVEAEGGSQEELSVLGVRVELGHVVGEVVALGVLGLGDVSGKDGTGLEGDIDHHLEHVDGVVLNAVSLEVHALLIVVHLHITAGHLDHTVVDGLVSVLQGLKVSVLEGEESTGGLFSLVTGTNVHKET